MAQNNNQQNKNQENKAQEKTPLQKTFEEKFAIDAPISFDDKDPIKQVNSYEVSVEVIDGKLYVNTLSQESKDKSTRQEFVLGKDFQFHKGPSGVILYGGEKVYFIDKVGRLKTISIPEEFGDSLNSSYVIESSFQKHGVFVVYKHPKGRDDSGLCFIFDSRKNLFIKLKTDHKFHNYIIGNVTNLDFYIKDIVKGELFITINGQVKKAPIKNIVVDKQTNHGQLYAAVIGDLTDCFLGDFYLYQDGNIQTIDGKRSNEKILFQNRYKIIYDDNLLTIIDIEKNIETNIPLKNTFYIKEVFIKADGNFFCIMASIEKDESLSFLHGNINHVKDWSNDGVFITPVEYTEIRAACLGASTLNMQEFSFVGKKHNRPRNFIIFNYSLGERNFFEYELRANELLGDKHIEYDNNVYKVSSVMIKDPLKNPTLIEYRYFSINPKAADIKAKLEKQKIQEEKIRVYQNAIIAGEIDYSELKKQNEKLKKQAKLLQDFLDAFSIGNKKGGVFGKEKEFVDFDPDMVIDIYKSIKDQIK